MAQLTLTSYLEKVTRLGEGHPQRQVFFRGHSLEEYKLLPSAFRTKNWKENEHLMFRQLLAENPKDFEGDQSSFDKLVRSQHYGLPTRLLDLSTNALVGLYFACCSNFTKDGEVILVSSSHQRHKYFDSDVVSLLANMALLRRGEKDELLQFARSYINDRMKKDERIKEFSNCQSLDRLVQMVRAEKPYFRSRVDPFDLGYVVTVTPRKTHERIKAQEGVFMLFGMTEGESGTHLENLRFEQIGVPASSKEGIIEELSKIGVSRRVLFPEIENSAEQIKKRYS